MLLLLKVVIPKHDTPMHLKLTHKYISRFKTTNVQERNTIAFSLSLGDLFALKEYVYCLECLGRRVLKFASKKIIPLPP